MITAYHDMIRLTDKVNNLFKVILYSKRKKVIKRCPHCSSTSFIRYGKYKGIQRFKCRECKKTFSLTTNSVWYYSKKKADAWTNFIEMMLEKKSLRFIAGKLKINLTTAFYWRHKVMDTMCEDNKVYKLENYVHILTDRIPENHKGSKNIVKDESFIWIATAKDAKDNIISEPISRGLWSYSNFNEKIAGKIDEKAFVKGYQNRYVYIWAQKHNTNIEDKTEVNRDKSVETYMNMYFKWFADFRGIATKYLREYLNWFMIFYREKKYYCFNYMERMIKVKKYIRTFEIGIED